MAIMRRVPSPCLSCVEHRAYPFLTAPLSLAHTALTHLAHPQGGHEGFHPKLPRSNNEVGGIVKSWNLVKGVLDIVPTSCSLPEDAQRC